MRFHADGHNGGLIGGSATGTATHSRPDDGESALERLADLALSLGNFEVSLQSGRVNIRALDPSGLSIWLELDQHGCVACIGGMLQDFESVEQGALWARRALTGDCRLRIERRGHKVRAYILQLRSADGRWIDALGSGFVRLWPAWLAGGLRYEHRSNG